MRFAAYTGLRATEIAGWRAGRIDLLRGVVHLVQTTAAVQGDELLGRQSTKTRQRRAVAVLGTSPWSDAAIVTSVIKFDRLRGVLVGFLGDRTGQRLEAIQADLHRDLILTADAANACGVLDAVGRSRSSAKPGEHEVRQRNDSRR